MSPSTLSPIRNSRPATLLLAAVALGNLPLLLLHLRNMWGQPQYQYFPIVLLAIGWLMYRTAAWRSEPLTSQVFFRAGVGAFAGSLVVSLAGTWLLSPWLGTLSLVIAFAGLLLVLRNYLEIQNPVGIWFLSLLLLRPPMGLDTRLAFWLQGLTAKVAGSLLDLLRVVNLVEGNTIVLADRHLFVEEACSGIVSLMSIIACCMILAVWQNRPAPHATLLTISGAVWAGVLNVFRITIVAFALDKGGVDLTSGWRHEALGLALFVGTLGLSFCTDRLLLFLMNPIQPQEAELCGNYAPHLVKNPLSRIFNFLVEPGGLFYRRPAASAFDETPASETRPAAIALPGWIVGVAVLFLLTGAAQGVRAGFASDTFRSIEPHAHVLALNETSLPTEFSGLQREGFDSAQRDVADILGEHSRTWRYSGLGQETVLSMDFVFHSFHELTRCYAGNGWRIMSRQVGSLTNGASIVVAELARPDSRERAFLLFAAINSEGQPIAPPESSLLSGLQTRVTKHRVPGGAYQVQLFVPAKADLTQRQRERATEVFASFHDRISEIIAQR